MSLSLGTVDGDRIGDVQIRERVIAEVIDQDETLAILERRRTGLEGQIAEAREFMYAELPELLRDRRALDRQIASVERGKVEKIAPSPTPAPAPVPSAPAPWQPPAGAEPQPSFFFTETQRRDDVIERLKGFGAHELEENFGDYLPLREGGWEYPEQLSMGTGLYVLGAGTRDPAVDLYAVLNEKMRSGKTLTDEEASVLGDIVRDAKPARDGERVFRGMRLAPSEIPKPGDEIDLKALTSTSPDPRVAAMFADDFSENLTGRPIAGTTGVVYDIHVPGGTKRVMVTHTFEEKIILPGYTLRVNQVHELENPISGMTHIVQAQILKERQSVPREQPVKMEPRKQEPATPPAPVDETPEVIRKFLITGRSEDLDHLDLSEILTLEVTDEIRKMSNNPRVEWNLDPGPSVPSGQFGDQDLLRIANMIRGPQANRVVEGEEFDKGRGALMVRGDHESRVPHGQPER